jgi:fructoselysine 6-phosphate deglycase
MAVDIDRVAFLQSVEVAAKNKDQAAKLGADLVAQGIRRVYLVGCGSPNRGMATIKYWLDRDAKSLETYLYFPSEFINATPARLDEHSLVVLGSNSGTTPEVLAAAEYLKGKPAITVGVTQLDDSPLAQAVKYPLLYGKSNHGFQSLFMVTLAMLSSMMNEIEGWPYHNDIMQSLANYPATLLDAHVSSEKRVEEEARLYKDENFMMLVGAGPCYANAYVFGTCVLMEMQWLRTFACESAEFFHGPFEIIDHTTPLIIFMGEDPSRPETERVVNFAKKFTEKLMIYDSKDYKMSGIEPSVRGIFAPFILEGAIERFAAHLAIWRNHPLNTRRYMWKIPY